MITYISYFVAGGYNDFYRELNEQDYDVMLDDTPRGNTTFFWNLFIQYVFTLYTYVLETEIWILATFITSSLTTSADVRNPNAAGRELVGQILFKNVTL